MKPNDQCRRRLSRRAAFWAAVEQSRAGRASSASLGGPAAQSAALPLQSWRPMFWYTHTRRPR